MTKTLAQRSLSAVQQAYKTVLHEDLPSLEEGYVGFVNVKQLDGAATKELFGVDMPLWVDADGDMTSKVVPDDPETCLKDLQKSFAVDMIDGVKVSENKKKSPSPKKQKKMPETTKRKSSVKR